MPISWALLLLQLLSITADLDVPGTTESPLRIVNGIPIDISLAPWQVSIQILGHHICGGSILNAKIIITAAHCLNLPANEMQVRAGSTIRRSGGQLVNVAYAKKHPGYVGSPYSNDIGLLLLKKKLNLGYSANKIALASDSPNTGTTAFVSGWGRYREHKSAFTIGLHMAIMSTIDRKKCQKSKYAERKMKIAKGMICAASDGKDACQGDSGGPLVASGKLVGIVSWGLGCAKYGYPGVYTDVAYYRDWVLQNMNTIGG
ncbi:trypsin alpha-like [Drosophila montana]|uniref:trypsin alpha-like n=1 Tax=Drosophila montana TaxID=40370 RepID=UPI00313BBFE7